ncbi:MAG: GntR family transcriptional regulator [Chloroflexi bacterium]|nr:GntR family transcriptional regulator [Chloroflexota bacterium]
MPENPLVAQQQPPLLAPLIGGIIQYPMMSLKTADGVAPGPAAASLPSVGTPSVGLPSVSRYRTLEEGVYDDLRAAIVSGQLPPGSRIIVDAVARDAGISRLPVIHALKRLQSEGFVQIHPHKDVLVAQYTPEEVAELYDILSALEALTVRGAARRITDAQLAHLRRLHERLARAQAEGRTDAAAALDKEFHFAVWDCSGLEHTIPMVQTLWDRYQVYRERLYARSGFPSESIDEHAALLDALAAHDFGKAMFLCRQHRRRARRRVLAAMSTATEAGEQPEREGSA